MNGSAAGASVSPASMKVPTRRWGNQVQEAEDHYQRTGLNESPHPKVGKFFTPLRMNGEICASMKVPTRRWGNVGVRPVPTKSRCLNESPHPKVGKSSGLKTVYTGCRMPQ